MRHRLLSGASVGALAFMLSHALSVPLHAQTDTTVTAEETVVKGVNPADNLTKFELLPKFTMIDGDNDISISTLTLKYDRAIRGLYGVNIELPVAYFSSPFDDEFGIGDLNLRGRVQFRTRFATWIVGVEAVFPIASADALGTGKFQLNPVLVGVYPFSPETFIAVVAKHYFSVAGDEDRADIVQGQYRVLAAYASKGGWWLLADPQVWVDYENDARVHFAPEAEVGRMIAPLVGVWIRGGAHVSGDWEKDDWTVSGGVRFISF